ncbi:MAG TPA: CDP-alcohol phosphatidyltransferase family protein [Longimicrobiales bacterium]|nr:CDP-alcohol phosphatidyltransferase family protein [Longimicrobiales bacterium]
MNLPNLISLLRIPLALAFLLADGMALRVGIVAIAGFSDWADGALARRTGRTTRAGELLDPIADRTFMVAALVGLALDGLLPWWSVPLLLLRDIGVVLGAALVLSVDRSVRLPARPAGKRLTWAQFAAVALILLRPGLAGVVVVPVVVMGVVALTDYATHVRTALAATGRTRGDEPHPERRQQ